MSDTVEKVRYIYDLETYPNCFTMTTVRNDGKHVRQFEVSDRVNDTQHILKAFRYFKNNKIELVGFNNLGFDYPIIHKMMLDAIQYKQRHGENTSFQYSYETLYGYAQEIIESYKNGGRFGTTVKNSEIIIPQIDLFKLHHFDNAAKSTSLKMLEFNMRSDSIEDLPFPVGTWLTGDQIVVLLKYNLHDVKETLKFYNHSLSAITFREELSEKLGFNLINFNDTKIGKEYFIKKLEEQIPGVCYKFDKFGRKHINQTKRDSINLSEILFDYYDFKRPEFIAVKDWFAAQVITETKGVFSDIEEHELGDVAKYSKLLSKRHRFMSKPTDEMIAEFKQKRPMGWIEEQELKQKRKGIHLKSYWKHWRVAETLNVIVDGFQYDFGTGGIHGSVSSEVVTVEDDEQLVDADVSSMYPNIGISNRVYPKHLSEKFCDIYQDVYNQRKSFKKGTVENAVMKLALNGVYGDSNNKFSALYDPAYTMAITVNGQLSLCLLAEKLIEIESLKVVQCNTDGITVKLKSKDRHLYDKVCANWQKQVGLELEFAEYSKMFIRDCNNYIALYTNGKIKRKGAYQYEDLQWHQNQSCLVVPKAAEANMIYGKDILEFVKNHSDNYDFMLRTKVDRSSSLLLEKPDDETVRLQNICRYYPVMQGGGQLVKVMKPLAGKTELRRFHIDDGWMMLPANDISLFDRNRLCYDYYVKEAMKLVALQDPTKESTIEKSDDLAVE